MKSRRRGPGYMQPEPQPVRMETAGPPVSLVDLKRSQCARWRPYAHAVRIVDSKDRTWLVYDREGTDTHFDRIIPLGSQPWGVRVFWREDHVRIRHFSSRDGDQTMRSISRDALLQQLRYSERDDEREGPIGSAAELIQNLYESRRGMGRR